MMKNFGGFICALAFASTAFAQQRTEEGCEKNVDAFVSGLEFASQRKGIEPKLKDLTVNDIREIQKKQGSCVAEDEVTKRL